MENFLLKWLEQGKITKEQYNNFLDDILKQKEQNRKIKTQITLYIIGAILLGIGVVLFISANDWLLEFLNRCNFLKIFLLSSLSISSLFFGYKMTCANSKFPRLGASLVFLSAILIGAVYALIAQIYQVEADCSMLYFIWLLSVYPLAFIFRSRAINILSCVIFLIFILFFTEVIVYSNDFNYILIPILSGSFLYALGNISKIKKNFNDFSLQYKIIGLFLVFIPLLILTFDTGSQYKSENFSFLYLLISLFVFHLLIYFLNKEKTKLLALETIYFCALAVFLSLICSISVFNHFFVQTFANLFIILKIAILYSYGIKFENVKLVDLANKILTIYLIVNYIRFGSKYFEGAAFFIIGGILLFSLGLYLEKTKKGLVLKDKTE